MKAPDHMSEEELLKLPPAKLAERCWAATVNADYAAEAWARVAELTAILEDDKATAAVRLYVKLKAHQKHVNECRTGSCENEFNALVKAGLASPMDPRRPA